MAEVEAERGLDAEVAEKVVGWGRVGRYLGPAADSFGDPIPGVRDRRTLVPKYSTDIVAAWQVVERMQELGFHLVLWFDDRVTGQWGARFPHGLAGRDSTDYGRTAPRAICRAALTAVAPPKP